VECVKLTEKRRRKTLEARRENANNAKRDANVNQTKSCTLVAEAVVTLDNLLLLFFSFLKQTMLNNDKHIRVECKNTMTMMMSYNEDEKSRE
jgi:hypothetical protein